MAHKVKEPIDVAVLNAVAAAAADITLSGGNLSVTNLSEVINLSDGVTSVYDAYAAGTLSEKDYDFTAATLLANHTYRLAVVVDGFIAFHGGGQEANQLIAIREYNVSTGSVAPTAAQLRDLFITRINLDPDATVTASDGGGNLLTLDLNVLTYGDFRVEAPDGVTEAIVVAWVHPAGTPAIVDGFVTGQSSPTAQYNTYTISFDKSRRHSAVGGGFVEYPEDVKIFFDSLDADAAAFVVEMDAVLAGTHTPVADYLGI